MRDSADLARSAVPEARIGDRYEAGETRVNARRVGPCDRYHPGALLSVPRLAAYRGGADAG